MRRHHHRLHSHQSDLQAVYTRRRLLVGGAISAVPLFIWARSGRPQATGAPITTEPKPAAPQIPSSTDPVVQLPPSSSESTVAGIDHDLREGMSEADVELLQARLLALGFDPGPIDGYFGNATLRSVWAFEKLVLGVPRTEMTGVVNPTTWEQMNAPTTISPRRTPGGTHVEVYLPEQVAALFVDGAVRLATHVSTGEGVEWCDEVTIDNDDGTTTTKGICGISVTPGGVYHFERKVDGWRNAALGRLYNPVYFNYGIAIHGASNVPAEPKSRGCVRIPMHIAEYFPDLVSIGDTVYVFDGVDEPEHYGAQLPFFDWRDPDSTTTSTSTTTTTSTTTSTVPPQPSTTTTVPPPAAEIPPETTSTTTTLD